MYRVFHEFGQALFAFSGFVSYLSQFPLPLQMLQKTTLDSKMVKSRFENNHRS